MTTTAVGWEMFVETVAVVGYCSVSSVRITIKLCEIVNKIERTYPEHR